MTNAEEAFRRELEVFRREQEAGAQFLYAYFALHAVPYDNPAVLEWLNTAPLFWNTCAGALQMSAFIVLGRIFDQNSPHNVDTLLRMAERNPTSSQNWRWQAESKRECLSHLNGWTAS